MATTLHNAGEIPAPRTQDDGPKTVPAVQPANRPVKSRDLFIDSMRAVALLRVFLLHLFGFMWLPLLFPSMSIMFAMAGSLMAASLDRRRGDHWLVLRDRLHRLLPPLWLLGAVLVPIMLIAGWTESWPDPTVGFSLGSLIHWVIPFQTPPASALGETWVIPLWYVRTYLWFMLLSPALLWMFRRWPRRVVAVPVGIVALFFLGVMELGGGNSYEVRDFAVYLVAWLVGFAHHDGMLHRIKGRMIAAASLAMLGLSAVLMLGYNQDLGSWDLDLHPDAQLLHGIAFTLLVLRFSPSMGWAARIPGYTRLIAAVNARAMTIYLWGNVAIFTNWLLLERIDPEGRLWESGWLVYPVVFASATTILLLMVMATGWAEDLAARRKPRIIPAAAR